MRNKFIFLVFLSFSLHSFADNAYYITLSNQIARKQDLSIIANNAANTNTPGYEEDATLYKSSKIYENSKSEINFVQAAGIYKPGALGALKITNNPLDVAIIGEGQYFKILTTAGVKYTLAGSMIKNSDGALVNSLGMPFLSQNNDFLQVPIDTRDIQIAQDGTIYADGEAQNRIGVAYFPNKNTLIKEGDSLYASTAPEVPIDEYTIQSGALRLSNVNATRVMSQTIEAQRSFSTTSALLKEISDMEKQSVSRILRAQ
jgi:flagellar basal-body rod protein FlgF